MTEFRPHVSAARLNWLLTLLILLLAHPRRTSSATHEFSPTNINLHPSLAVSLYAAEPDVVDPVALAFDSDGRVYVVEMRDYPLGIGPEHRPGGTVRLLEGRDGDGRIDRSTLFAEKLSFPTSIAPWNGGVLVTAPPEIVFLKDTDGDGKADVREVVLSGFTLGVTDSNVNGLRWGLDNRVHGANGGNGGKIVSLRKPGSAVPLRDADFSFDPRTGDFAVTYQTSGGFGLGFDAWGRSFATYNINHIQQRFIPLRYLRRHPGFPLVKTTVSISDHGEMSRIFPISTPETRVNHPEQAGHFSAAGGMGWIGSPLYAGDLPGSILVCDVVGNLVHRDLLVAEGPGFIAKRSPDEQSKEFFASRDNACRPVGVELGPDGALYIIDMQRDVIEHPDYIPQKVKEKLDLRAGEDRGRIYRVTPKGGLPVRKSALNQASAEELVRELANPNPWWRTTAQRLLWERRDQNATPALKAMARNHDQPLGRLHALWSLNGLGLLDEALVLDGLADATAGIRENSLELAEHLLPGSAALRRKVLSLASDDSPRVRFQAALTLGHLDGEEVQAALLKILLRDHEFGWTRLAVLSSVRSGADALLRSLLESADFRASLTVGKRALIAELADVIGARLKPGETGIIPDVLSALARNRIEEPLKIAALEGLQSGIERSGTEVRANASLAVALENAAGGDSPALVAAGWKLSRTLGLPENQTQRKALANAIAKTRDRAELEPVRIENIRVLGLGSFDAVAPTLFSLMDGAETSPIQSAALETLRQFNEPEIAKTFLRQWRTLAPSVRPAVVNLLLQRRAYHEFLVGALEAGEIRPGELNLDLEQRRRLLRKSSAEISGRAAKFFGDEEYSNRKSVVEEWLKKLPATGDPSQGREIFEKTCAQCHAVDGLGFQVGPDLSDVTNRSIEDLVSNILDPNMAINPSYISFNVELTSDELETGILQSESAQAVTLLQAQGKKLIVPRSKIRRMQSSGLSLMPEGLEAGLTPVDLRDLVEFLQRRR